MSTARVSVALAAASALFLSACMHAPPVPISTVTSSFKASVSSSTHAKVEVVTTQASGTASTILIPVGGILFPAIPNNARLQYNTEDQQDFGTALRNEITRLGIAKLSRSPDTPEDELNIKVVFLKTYFDSAWASYTLDVELMLSGGKSPARHLYRVLSSEKDTRMEKVLNNAFQGKEKATRLLLEKMLPDVESYVGSMSQR